MRMARTSVLAFLVLLLACEGEDITGLQDQLAVSDLKAELLNSVSEDNLIIEVDSTTRVLTIKLESGDVVSAPSRIVSAVTANRTNWTIEFSFAPTEETLTLPFRGDSFTTELSEFNDSVFPLIQPLKLSLPYRGKVRYTVRGKSGSNGDILSPAITVGRTGELTLLGLYFGHVNQVTLDYYSNGDVLRTSQELTVARDAGPPSPEVEILVNEETDGPVKLFLTAYRGPERPFIVDQFGDIRWYADIPAYWALQQSQNGNLLWGDHIKDQVVELSLDGKTLRTISLPRPYESIHHDVHELSNGDLLLTVQNSERETVQDFLVLLDRTFGHVIKVWDLNLSIPRNYALIYDETDWLHVNAVTVDERDHSVILSSQRRGLFKVSWDNELKWILSDGRGFEDHTEFLLDAHGDAFWGQHDIRLDEENDTYYVFDNGLGRNYSNAERFSRGVRFKVDEEQMTATVLQEYGRDRTEYFSPIISGIDYREDGHTLVNFGSQGYLFSYSDSLDWRGTVIKPDPVRGASWIEYDAAGRDVFEATFSMPRDDGFGDQGIYRARYVDLFKAMR